MRPKYVNKIIFSAIVLGLLGLAFFWGDSPGKSDESGEFQPSPTISGAQDKNLINSRNGQAESLPPADQSPIAEETGAAAAAASPTASAQTTAASSSPTLPTTAVEGDLSSPAVAGEGTAKQVNTCTLAVRCTAILDNMDKFNRRKLQVLPADGIIYPAASVTFTPGESAYNILQRELRKAGIHLETSTVPLYNSVYIEGIGNIYELDCGELSGWVYKINGKIPGYGCSLYKLQAGDSVEFIYTCNLGRDAGGNDFSEE